MYNAVAESIARRTRRNRTPLPIYSFKFTLRRLRRSFTMFSRVISVHMCVGRLNCAYEKSDKRCVSTFIVAWRMHESLYRYCAVIIERGRRSRVVHRCLSMILLSLCLLNTIKSQWRGSVCVYVCSGVAGKSEKSSCMTYSLTGIHVIQTVK